MKYTIIMEESNRRWRLVVSSNGIDIIDAVIGTRRMAFLIAKMFLANEVP